MINEINQLRHRLYVIKFFEKLKNNDTNGSGEKSDLTLFRKRLNVSLKDSQKSVEAIAEGGEYSIDAVATRIMDMVKALFGGDKSKIPLLMDAVRKGFEATGLEFNDGAGLTNICYKTFDEVMKRFDE